MSDARRPSGPPPVPDEDQVEEETLEAWIEQRDEPASDELTTSTDPRPLGERLAEEAPEGPTRGEESTPLVEYDEPDDEPQLLAERGDDGDPWISPEEAAVHERDRAPGGTDDADDGYGDDASS
jgi:hypothetical protein